MPGETELEMAPRGAHLAFRAKMSREKTPGKPTSEPLLDPYRPYIMISGADSTVQTDLPTFLL